LYQPLLVLHPKINRGVSSDQSPPVFNWLKRLSRCQRQTQLSQEMIDSIKWLDSLCISNTETCVAGPVNGSNTHHFVAENVADLQKRYLHARLSVDLILWNVGLYISLQPQKHISALHHNCIISRQYDCTKINQYICCRVLTSHFLLLSHTGLHLYIITCQSITFSCTG